MAGPITPASLIDAELAGQSTLFTWRKRPAATTGAGIWVALLISPGNPAPQYMASNPLAAARLAQSTHGGLYHGVTAAPAEKRLMSFCAMSAGAGAVPLPMIVADHLLYYPFVDMSDTEPQVTDNTVGLSRYAESGGQIMAVVTAGQSGTGTFFVTYTNQDGVSGRVTPTHFCNTQVATGTVVTTTTANAAAAGPFMALQGADSGVRSIDQVQFVTPDVGLITLVLVRTLQTHSLLEITAPVELVNAQDVARLPKIEDDAYLNTIACPSASMLGADIHGYLQTIWVN